MSIQSIIRWFEIAKPQLGPFIDRKVNHAKAREKLKELVVMDDSIADEIEHQATKRLARPQK